MPNITSLVTTDGHLLKRSGTTITGVDPDTVGGSSSPARWTAGYYYSPLQSSRATQAHGTGIVTFTPLWVPEGSSIDRIGCEVTTAIASGVVRLGVYADDNGKPGSLLLDGGTVSSATTGMKEATVSQVLADPLHWLAVVPQVASATLRVSQNLNAVPLGVPALANVGGTLVQTCYYQSGVTGSLATTATITGTTHLAYLAFVRAV